MKLRLLPSVVGRESEAQLLSSYVINQQITIDAGSIGLIDDVRLQRSIKHVVLTHAHIDHIASLGILIDNLPGPPADPLTVHCTAEVADCLTRHYFNGRIWPNVFALPDVQAPYAKLRIMQPGTPLALHDLEILPIEVNHSVPAVGLIVRDSNGAIVVSGDTGPTDEIWRHATQRGDLRAVVLEVSFPDTMQAQAAASGHLTPSGLAAEIAKLRGMTPRILAVHLKPAYRPQIVDQLRALGLPQLEVLVPGRTYEF
jgi:cAMP phosphodiesterase